MHTFTRRNGVIKTYFHKQTCLQRESCLEGGWSKYLQMFIGMRHGMSMSGDRLDYYSDTLGAAHFAVGSFVTTTLLSLINQ